MRLIPLALLTLVPSSRAYIDCRTACRACRESTEPEPVLEVYCSMCTECREQRNQKLHIRSTKNLFITTEKIIRMNDVNHGDVSNVVDDSSEHLPEGCPTNPPCSDFDEAVIENSGLSCPPMKKCKKEKLALSLPQAPLPYCPQYPAPYPGPVYGGCMPLPLPPPLPIPYQFPVHISVPLPSSTTTSTTTTTTPPSTTRSTTTRSTTTRSSTTTRTTTTEPPPSLPLCPMFLPPPCPVPCYPPYQPPPGYYAMAPGYAPVPIPTYTPFAQPHSSAIPSNRSTSSTSADFLYMYVGIPKNIIRR